MVVTMIRRRRAADAAGRRQAPVGSSSRRSLRRRRWFSARRVSRRWRSDASVARWRAGTPSLLTVARSRSHSISVRSAGWCRAIVVRHRRANGYRVRRLGFVQQRRRKPLPVAAAHGTAAGQTDAMRDAAAHLRDLLERAGLAHHADALLEAASPSIRLVPEGESSEKMLVRPPASVWGLESVVKAVAGSYHNLALRDDRTVAAWGENGAGQLGDGTRKHRRSPCPSVTQPTSPRSRPDRPLVSP